MLKHQNRAAESITAGNIKVLGSSYNHSQLMQSRIMIDTLRMSKNHGDTITEITSDSVITPIEKIELKRISDDVDNQKATLYAQYSDYSMTSHSDWTNYDTAYGNLHDLFVLIFADMESSYTIAEGTSLSNLFTAYYTMKIEAEDTLSKLRQAIVGKVSQFGIQLNTATFDGAVDDPGYIFVHGYNGSGDPAILDADEEAIVANIYYNGARIDITCGAHDTGFTSKKGFFYIPQAGGSIGSCYYHAGDNQFKTSADVQVNETTNLLIGEFTAGATGVLGPVVVYNSAKDFTRVRASEFMNILIGASDSTDMNNMLTNIGGTFFQYLIATNAIIKNLLAANLKVGAGSESAGFLFRADYDNGDPLTGDPRIEVYFGGSLVFKINPTTGDINFGDPNTGGLIWDNANSRIKSKDNKLIIGSDGKVTMTDFTANSGTFKGDIDSSKLTTINAYTYSITSADSYKDAFDRFYGKWILGSLNAAGSLTRLEGLPSVSFDEWGAYGVHKLLATAKTIICSYGLTSIIKKEGTGSISSFSVSTAYGRTVLLSAACKGYGYFYFIDSYDDVIIKIVSPQDSGNWSSYATEFSVGSGGWKNLAGCPNGSNDHKMMYIGDAGAIAAGLPSTTYGVNTATHESGVDWKGVHNVWTGDNLTTFWIICGTSSKIAISPAGEAPITSGVANFTTQTVTPPTGSVTWYDVVYNSRSERIILVGSGGKIAVSNDGGSNWSFTSFGSSDIKKVIATREGRVFVCTMGTGSSVIGYSDDGYTFYNTGITTSRVTSDIQNLVGLSSQDEKIVLLDSSIVATWYDEYEEGYNTVSIAELSELDTTGLGDLRMRFDDDEDKEIIIHDKDLECDLLLNAPLDDKIMAKVDLIVPKGLKIYDI